MRVGILLIAVALIAGMVVYIANHPVEICDWYDLNAIRDNLGGSYLLMNDLDSTTPGYTELASPTANGGKGWQPIGTWPNMFTGSFNGQEYEIRNLFINRPDEVRVGLFGYVSEGGVIKNLGVMNANVTGYHGVGGLVGGNEADAMSNSHYKGSVSVVVWVGGLAGWNKGTVINSYYTGGVTGSSNVGGLLGENDGTIINSHSTGNVTGNGYIGGLVGFNDGTVSNSYFTGDVTGNGSIGGLIAQNYGTVRNSYSSANVNGEHAVGGLLGHNGGTLSNCYSTGSVSGNDCVGGLVGYRYNGSAVNNCFSSGSVIGDSYVGGLLGYNEEEETMSDSFWDIETSGQSISDGGTGKTTAQMKDIATFSGAGWKIIAVALNKTNPSYIWNIVNGQTYPFLSWQSVS